MSEWVLFGKRKSRLSGPVWVVSGDGNGVSSGVGSVDGSGVGSIVGSGDGSGDGSAVASRLQRLSQPVTRRLNLAAPGISM